MAGITAAGAGSGLQLEDIIKSTLDAKRSQFESQTVKKETTLKTSLSGIGQLKSSLSTFITAAKKLSETGAFNLRTVNVTQDKDNPVLQVESNSGASNGNYNIVVSQLAKGSRLESNAGSFSSATQVVATADGQLTFKAGADKSFTVDVKAGDTLQDVRSRINSNGSNFGLSANIINLNGESKLVFDSSVSGSGNDLTISASTSELKIFDTSDPASKFTTKQSAQDANITIDNVAVSSKSNVFDNVVQGMKITVLRESDKDSSNAPVANKVAISTDTKGVQDKITNFVKAYNTLESQMDALGKRPSIVAGERQDDGGLLAGDSTLRSIKDFMFQTLSTPSTNGGAYQTIFDIGIKIDNAGQLSVDSTKLTTAMTTNFDQVGALFGGTSGVAAALTTELENYTKTGGRLAQQEDGLNSDMRQIRNKRSDFEAGMVTYEASLRKRYGDLDSLLVKLNKSAASLSAIS